MRRGVKLLLIGLAGVGVVSVASPVSADEEGAGVGEDRWVPSLAVVSGVTVQDQSGDVTSFDSLGNPIDDRVSASGSDLAVTPYVGGNLQLLSPALPLPGRPRLFVDGELLPSFGQDRDVALERDPGSFVPPAGINYPDTAVRGQGSSTTATLDTWVFAAAVGVAFPFEFMGRRLWAKPSFGWIRYKVDVEGLVRDVQCTPFPPPPANVSTNCQDLPPNLGTFPPFLGFDGFERNVTLSASDSQWFNGIGPGLELELSVGRFGPVGSSLFLDAHAYRILGKRKVSLTGSASFPQSPPGSGHPPGTSLPGTLPAADYTANWSFETNPWMFRAGAGVRFQWLGFER